jgi:hypothetical protein
LGLNIDYDFGALLVSQQYGQFLPSLNKQYHPTEMFVRIGWLL